MDRLLLDTTKTSLAAMHGELARILHIPSYDLPRAFTPPILPLDRSVGRQLCRVYHDADPAAVEDWLSRYMLRFDYLAAQAKEGSQYHDMDGFPIQPIPDHGRGRAKGLMRVKNKQAKRAQASEGRAA